LCDEKEKRKIDVEIGFEHEKFPRQEGKKKIVFL
jgi:hypothetical protein